MEFRLEHTAYSSSSRIYHSNLISQQLVVSRRAGTTTALNASFIHRYPTAILLPARHTAADQLRHRPIVGLPTCSLSLPLSENQFRLAGLVHSVLG